MPTKLSVNINKIATLRNTRHLDIPSLTHFATIALQAGAHGITIHPRPDERHIRTADVPALADLLKNFPHAEFNIEGNPFFPDYMSHIRAVRPTQCTLVPDSIDTFTSNQGWSLTKETCQKLHPLIAEMKSLGCRVSLFMEDETRENNEMAIARSLGADRIELYTEPYAAAFISFLTNPRADDLPDALVGFSAAARRATAAGLAVNAGHDLNLQNLPQFLHAIPQIAEVSIGHALIADALEFGMTDTIHRYLAACKPAA